MEIKKGVISRMTRNKRGITTLTVKTGLITQGEFDELSQTSKVAPTVKIEIT